MEMMGIFTKLVSRCFANRTKDSQSCRFCREFPKEPGPSFHAGNGPKFKFCKFSVPVMQRASGNGPGKLVFGGMSVGLTS